MNERDFQQETVRERVVLRLNSEAEAIALVKEFWKAMPHQNGLTMPQEDDAEGWMSELTAGDRTRISKGVLPADKGRWVVMVMGNNQPLTREAESWLRGKGF